MKEKRMFLSVCLYSATMLLLLGICAVRITKHSSVSEQQSTEIQRTEAETVYIYVEVTETISDIVSETPTIYAWVREHEEKIGVFDQNGTLLEVWNVYTKTLPKADRVMLREGVALYSEAELVRLREDYTS